MMGYPREPVSGLHELCQLVVGCSEGSHHSAKCWDAAGCVIQALVAQGWPRQRIGMVMGMVRSDFVWLGKAAPCQWWPKQGGLCSPVLEVVGRICFPHSENPG